MFEMSLLAWIAVICVMLLLMLGAFLYIKFWLKTMKWMLYIMIFVVLVIMSAAMAFWFFFIR